MGKAFYEFSRILVTLFLKIFFRVSLIGKENIPLNEGVLLYSNHKSMLDMFVISYGIKPKVHYMAKAELFKFKPLGYIIKVLGGFPVKRGAGDVQAVKTVYKYIQEGKIVGLYPEGTRVKKGKKIKPKAGAALFAVKTGATILPVAIEGNYKLFSKIKVIFGKPYKIDYDGDSKPTKEELDQIAQGIMDRIYSMITD